MSRTIYVGAPGSGKTYDLFKSLSKEYMNGSKPKRGIFHKYRFIVVMPSFDTNSVVQEDFPEVQKLFKKSDIFYNTNEVTMFTIQETLEALKGGTKTAIIIFDDTGRAFTRKETGNMLMDLAVWGRHVKVYLYVLAQRVTMIHPDLRSASDMIVLMGPMTKRDVNTITNDYFPLLKPRQVAALLKTALKEPYDKFTLKKEKGGFMELYINEKKIRVEDMKLN